MVYMMHVSIRIQSCLGCSKPVNHMRVQLDLLVLADLIALHGPVPPPAVRHVRVCNKTPARLPATPTRGTWLTVRVPAEAVVVVPGLAAPHAAPAQHARPQAPLGRLGRAQVRGQQQAHHQPAHAALHGCEVSSCNMLVCGSPWCSLQTSPLTDGCCWQLSAVPLLGDNCFTH